MQIFKSLCIPNFNKRSIRCFRSFPEIYQNGPSPEVFKAGGVSRPKFKNPQKRASYILSYLKSHEYKALRGDREWPLIQPGDSVEVER